MDNCATGSDSSTLDMIPHTTSRPHGRRFRTTPKDTLPRDVISKPRSTTHNYYWTLPEKGCNCNCNVIRNYRAQEEELHVIIFAGILCRPLVASGVSGNDFGMILWLQFSWFIPRCCNCRRYSFQGSRSYELLSLSLRRIPS